MKTSTDKGRARRPNGRNPAELRGMFGENLRILVEGYGSVSALSRDLGINRTQFNRYLNGESFPRPDILYRICRFFDVDARILLEPVGALHRGGSDLVGHPEIADFVGRPSFEIDEDSFPSGIYRFSRRSFMETSRFLVGLVQIFRRDGFTFLRGFEAKEAMRAQGLSTAAAQREFRGYLMHQENGIGAIVSRRGSRTSSFNFLTRETSFQNNYWVGYTTRTVRESGTTTRVTRLVYEHLGNDLRLAIAAARGAGLVGVEALVPYHRRLLQIDDPFR